MLAAYDQNASGAGSALDQNFEGFYPLSLLPNKKNIPRFRAGLDNIDFQNRLVACYPDYVTTMEEKYYHDAEFAKSTLENPENIALVNLITRTISQLLLKMKDNIFSEYLKEVNLDLLRRNFPTSSLIDYSSKASLSETLKALTGGNENHIVDIMSVLWRLTVFLLENEGSSDPDRLEYIYDSFNIIGRSHFIDHEWTQAVTNDNESKFDFRPTDSISLGEAKIKSSFLKNLNPLKNRSTYFSECESISPPHLYQKNKSTGMPYLSGTSGIANCMCAMYPLFSIEFDSKTGQQLAEIISAFVIATGLNTAKEARDAIFITHEYLKSPGKLMQDYEAYAGIFKSLHMPAGQT